MSATLLEFARANDRAAATANDTVGRNAAATGEAIGKAAALASDIMGKSAVATREAVARGASEAERTLLAISNEVTTALKQNVDNVERTLLETSAEIGRNLIGKPRQGDLPSQVGSGREIRSPKVRHDQPKLGTL